MSGTTGFETLPVVLTVAEAAAVLRISKNAAYSGIALGNIPAVRVGRRILIPKARLLELLSGTTLGSDTRNASGSSKPEAPERGRDVGATASRRL